MTTRTLKARRSLLGILLSVALCSTSLRAQPQPAPAPASSPASSPADSGAADSAATSTSLRAARDALIDAADFQAALKPAEQVVRMLDGSNDPRLPTDIATLARVQAELDNFDAAELNYLKAIDLIQKADGEFSASLMDPYQGLGRSYIKSREFREAVTALDQARHISQRNLGLFNVDQTSLIDDLTTAYLGLGDTVTAEKLQQERLDNAVRRFGDTDPKTIPFHYQLASYYDESRMRSAAREQYETVVRLIRQQGAGDDTALLKPLRDLLRIDLLLGDRDDGRTQLLSILGRDANLEPTERALSLASLGDWSTAKDDAATARGYYTQAYDLLRDTSDKSPDDIFASPQMIDFIAPLSPVDRGERARPYAWGTIVLSFDVSADGRASNVTTVSASPAGLMDAAYDRRIRETHFRPRIAAGAPVATANVRFTHYFRYYTDRK